MWSQFSACSHRQGSSVCKQWWLCTSRRAGESRPMPRLHNFRKKDWNLSHGPEAMITEFTPSVAICEAQVLMNFRVGVCSAPTSGVGPVVAACSLCGGNCLKPGWDWNDSIVPIIDVNLEAIVVPTPDCRESVLWICTVTVTTLPTGHRPITCSSELGLRALSNQQCYFVSRTMGDRWHHSVHFMGDSSCEGCILKRVSFPRHE